MTTATGVLRRHLYTVHIEVWVDACDQQKLKINGEEAQAIVADYRQQTGQGGTMGVPGGRARLRFTKEAFLTALMQFIVSDDQVSLS